MNVNLKLPKYMENILKSKIGKKFEKAVYKKEEGRKGAYVNFLYFEDGIIDADYGELAEYTPDNYDNDNLECSFSFSEISVKESEKILKDWGKDSFITFLVGRKVDNIRILTAIIDPSEYDKTYPVLQIDQAIEFTCEDEKITLYGLDQFGKFIIKKNFSLEDITVDWLKNNWWYDCEGDEKLYKLEKITTSIRTLE